MALDYKLHTISENVVPATVMTGIARGESFFNSTHSDNTVEFTIPVQKTHYHARPFHVGYYIRDPHRHQHAEEIRDHAGDFAGRYCYLDARGIGRQVIAARVVSEGLLARGVSPVSTYGDPVHGYDYGVNGYGLGYNRYGLGYGYSGLGYG
ncbi:hypothetical protein AVEN_152520-1 [Araneus ventricosus]|uniref:Uncharacterized protein n=1 Tax=Araneus ventricosus TaxID=182803 RepID=A0A4Y2R9X4_ARAVE|nr:hypothetical protein AVEN_205724-1 [Araneus ventricosus]GBN72235.1 hypothetical protein AVEN_58009-1 [Araneus ventricosus]GBN72246.1 hypothetical protein AVEN_110539-1 [Araneus ventricosus]GBN72257.1 hypothetical protein AVEN_152520-1 [Araneus ventricosus]